MISVKCKACGKRYDYQEHGCCPACGAYNRPPRRDRVGVDGTVYHMSDSDFLENKKARRRSQGSKVCFERDVCYEDQARQVRNGGINWEEQLNNGIQWLQKQGKKHGKRYEPKSFMVLVVVLVLASLLPAILTTCASVIDNIRLDGALGEIISGIEEVSKPEKRPDSYYYESNKKAVGESFKWWGTETVVTEVAIGPEEAEYPVIVTVLSEDVWDTAMLYYACSDGSESCEPCELIEMVNEGEEYQLCFRAPDIDIVGSGYLEFAGYNGDVHCTTKVPLQ